MADDRLSMNLASHSGWWEYPKSRRVVEMRFSEGWFFHLLRYGFSYQVEAPFYPDDARICGVKYDPFPGQWLVYVESETYDEVPINVMPPVVRTPNVTITRLPESESGRG